MPPSFFFLLFLFLVISFSTTSANPLKTLYRLSVSATERPDKIWAMVPFFYTPCVQDLRLLSNPHCCRLAGVGRVSYTDHNKNAVLYWSLFHRSDHEMMRCESIHRINAPCFLSCWAFNLPTSSTSQFTFPFSMLLLSVLSAFAHWWKCATPIPSLPVHLLLECFQWVLEALLLEK